MKNLSYRTVIYAGTLVTGMTGLIYQVVWQKYLTFVVGSDARSVSLVVAVFLAGLAAGYRFWGRTSERIADRRRLLRVYGAIEIGIGLYAALFLPWLEVVRAIATSAPAWLLTDLLVTVLAVGAPTFLMGATIPLLVSVVPERPEEVHLAHARIYGLNTLGACLGAFASSFFLIPTFGLPATLGGAAAANLLVGSVFMANRLASRVSRLETIPEIPNRFPASTVYFYTLVMGTVTLSLEVAFVRVLNLTLGAGPHNFAIVVGVFILGLALGSLAITERLLSVRLLFRALVFLTIYLVVLFHTVPFWPYWMSNLRMLLRSIPVNYAVYHAGVVVFLALVLLPFLVPAGFMLPLAYALLPKNTADYGKKCGWLYFYNTLGTALGAVVLSYLLLSYVDLDTVFKIDVALLAVLAIAMFIRERRSGLVLTLGVIVLAFLLGPQWNRDSHYQGLFGQPDPLPYHFTGWFETPRVVTGIDFFEDGPDTTVTVTTRVNGEVAPDLVGVAQPEPGRPTSRALMNNGRSEGDTVGDYSTMVLAGILPYLHAPDRDGLEVAVVGLGTGLTAGVLAAGAEVGHLTAIEISATLIDAAPWFSEANFGLLDNERVEIVRMDGFRWFSRIEDQLDVVVSEPSVPWVAGVENLFTPEYYALVDRAMREDGVFMQWFPMYSIDPTQFRTILGNLAASFPELRMFHLSTLEVGVVASHVPIEEGALARRFAEPAITAAAAPLRWIDPAQLELLRIYDEDGVRLLAGSGETSRHSLAHPSLSYASDRVRFLMPPIDWTTFLDPRLMRAHAYREERQKALEHLLANHPDDIPCDDMFYGGVQLFCGQLGALREAWITWSMPMRIPVDQRAMAYEQLRQGAFLPASPEFIREQAQLVVESYRSASAPGALRTLLVLCERDGLWEEAEHTLTSFHVAGLIDEETRASLSRAIKQSQEAQRQYLESLKARR